MKATLLGMLIGGRIAPVLCASRAGGDATDDDAGPHSTAPNDAPTQYTTPNRTAD